MAARDRNAFSQPRSGVAQLELNPVALSLSLDYQSHTN